MDRADYERLRAVIIAFPAGFRVWFCRLSKVALIVPVAYTGWYPISATAFDRVHNNPRGIKHRRELWPTILQPKHNYVWLFNYSILKQLRRSPQSRLMLQSYARDLARIDIAGLAAAVLSPESERVVARFGMSYRGDMTHDGVSEKVFTARFARSCGLEFVPGER